MSIILGLDQGTSSSRAVLMRADGTLSHIAQRELPQIYPHPGWVEQDPEAIWSSQAAAVRAVLGDAGIDPSAIHCIGITNQRETTLVWERATGRPIANAIVWQDRRTAEDCAQLAASEHNGRNLEALVSEKTGLVLDAYFSASKIRWILQHVPGARAQATPASSPSAPSTLGSSGNSPAAVATSPMSPTPRAPCCLTSTLSPGIRSCSTSSTFPAPCCRKLSTPAAISAVTTELLPHGKITGIAGDQQAALFGQMCLRPGMAKNTYGTGCFLMLQTGTTPVRSPHRLLTTVAWRIAGQTNYALEGSIFVAGAAIQWLRDGLGILNTAPEVEALAASVPDSGGVIFVPALTGLGAPHWDPHARGAIFGLTRGATRAHLARAALEGITFRLRILSEPWKLTPTKPMAFASTSFVSMAALPPTIF